MTTAPANKAFSEQVGVTLLPHVIRYHEALRTAHSQTRCTECGYALTMRVTEAEHRLLMAARSLRDD